VACSPSNIGNRLQRKGKFSNYQSIKSKTTGALNIIILCLFYAHFCHMNLQQKRGFKSLFVLGW